MNQNPEQLSKDNIESGLTVCGCIIQDRGSFNPATVIGIAIREYLINVSPPDYILFVNKKHFGHIVIDECHRSIYNLWKQVLDYFHAFQIRLTAILDNHTVGHFEILWSKTQIRLGVLVTKEIFQSVSRKYKIST